MIRVSQWAEIRHMHLVQGLAKKEVARRLGIDVKTVRRALKRETAPLRRESPPRGQRMEPHRDRILAWMAEDPRLTAKRIGRLLEAAGETISSRTVRGYVAALRAEVRCREVYVRREHRPGVTMEVDFGETLARIGGEMCRLKFFVAALPASNAHFAKAYRVERLECLLDGIVSACVHFGGLPERLVLDNTSLAVKEVRRGRERVEHQLFAAFRGSLAVAVDFCAPGKGWEKGSVEGGVGYVRDNCFRPLPEAGDLPELNERILAELAADLPRRAHPEGGTVAEALSRERGHLRPLPAHLPDTCRVLAVTANKFSEVRVDRVSYSVPEAFAWRSLLARVYHDRVEVVDRDRFIARHPRSFQAGTRVLNPRHYLRVLAHKSRAVPEAVALKGWKLPAVFHELRRALAGKTRNPDREWIQVLGLLEEHPEPVVVAAVEGALSSAAPGLSTVRMLLRQAGSTVYRAEPAPLSRPELTGLVPAPPRLDSYDRLVPREVAR